RVHFRSEGASRRTVLKGIFGGIIGGASLASGTGRVFAEEEVTTAEATTTPDPNLDVATTPAPVLETATTAAPIDTGTTAAPDATGTTATPDTGTTAVPAATETETEAATACEAGWIRCGPNCVYGDCCPGYVCGECGTCELSADQYLCRHPDCCDHWDCKACEKCEQGWCVYKCNLGAQCCEDDKHDYCAECCGDRDCREEYGPCFGCHGGTCFDICYDQGLYCKYSVTTVEAGHEGHDPCVECLEDYHCYERFGGCGYCDEWGTCQSSCDKGQICCINVAPLDGPAAGSEPAAGCAWECCLDSDCGDCEYCNDHGYCKSRCSKGEVCCDNYGESYCSEYYEGCCGGVGSWCNESAAGAAGEKLDGSCCEGLFCSYDDKSKHGTCVECEDNYDCPDGYGGYGYCCGGYCKAECCKDKDCEWGVCSDGYCIGCASNDDCHYGKICCNGECEKAECCSAEDCGDCELCLNGWCYQDPAYGGFGDSCQAPPIAFAGEDYTPQFDCCDGLLCCETQKHGLTLVCLECCDDHDCGKGCSCDHGHCSCACESDKECAWGTCCCKDGTCSSHCCDVPEKPEKPHKPDYDTGGTDSIDTLPSTGSGSSQSASGWIGAAALGAAAAYLAGKKLSSSEAPPEAPEV
ncbi:MAG: LPXTG cell wall anchor domain-containing protein, partial [Thermomicrobiales bacterium]